MATFFHDLQIGENERLYFRYTGGQPAAITEAEYQRAVGSGLNARLTVYPPGNTLSSALAGGGWYDTATRVITASYAGSNLVQLGGQGSGMMNWGDTGLSVTLRIGTTGVPSTDTGGDSGSTGGSGDFDGAGSAVQSPAAPSLPPIPPLPTGNGNSGFQSSGSVGSQIGITGGNS
jgi:hypothetical protein